MIFDRMADGYSAADLSNSIAKTQSHREKLSSSVAPWLRGEIFRLTDPSNTEELCA